MSRRLHNAATVIDRSSCVALPYLSRFRLCLIASILYSFALAGDTGATFIYPIGGESFYSLDYVNVTYQSTFASPLLYTLCSINGVTRQSMYVPLVPYLATTNQYHLCSVQAQDAEPDNGAVLVHLNVTTNVPCWFNLSPGQVAGESVTSEKWTVLARSREQTTWSATATATPTPASSSVTMASITAARVADQTLPDPGNTGISPGAKIGIAIAVALGVVALSTLGFWLWWRRRQRREAANNMVNFVDGDIVNLMDGGRFEKRLSPPNAYYDPYIGASSQSTISPSTYGPAYHPSAPPVEQQQYYIPEPVEHQPALSIQPVSVPPPPAIANDNSAWTGLVRHPWSPPDYDAHSPSSEWSVQPESDLYHTVPHQSQSSQARGIQAAHPVEALPAILPEMKPQAELPAREGHHGHGYEQELPAPHQAPPSRNAPPNGLEIEEQKFLLSDIIALRQQKSRPAGAGQQDERPKG